MLKAPPKHWGVRTIEAYEKIECIGAGTYGQVYRAKDKVTREIVALKKIRTLNETHGLPLTTIREIKLLKYLAHQNIVGLIEVVIAGLNDFDEDEKEVEENSMLCNSRYTGGALYLVLEYVPHDLTGLMDRGYEFTHDIVRWIMIQLLEVMHHLHANDYLHRDIKCSNLLLTSDHELKLADFGLSRTIHQQDGLTSKVVTLWYRPPEALLGDTSYGGSLDMWSIGCVMAELFLGYPLFPGKTEVEQINRIFDICGTPTKENWPNYDQLPQASTLVPKDAKKGHLYQYLNAAISKSNKTFPTGALDLILDLLKLNPSERLQANEALQSTYFTLKPLTSDIVDSFPKITLPPSHEHDTKQLRRQKAKAIKRQRSGSKPPDAKRRV